ncbi:TMEM175 family protein [Acidobacteriota bacterium]
MKLKRADVSGAVISPERLMTLADGVFAIVMTLLVLELSVPAVKGLSANSDLIHNLTEMWPEFLIYGLSFMILGVFWVINHSIFQVVRRYDTTLVWLNIAFLMFVSLIPFSTSLAGKNGFITVTAVIYGINMLLLFNLGWAIFAFTTGKRQLVDEGMDPILVRGGKLMGLVYALIMLPAIGVAFVSPKLSFLIYTLFVFAFIFITILGRGEVAMVMPVRSEPDRDYDTGEK